MDKLKNVGVRIGSLTQKATEKPKDAIGNFFGKKVSLVKNQEKRKELVNKLNTKIDNAKTLSDLKKIKQKINTEKLLQPKFKTFDKNVDTKKFVENQHKEWIQKEEDKDIGAHREALSTQIGKKEAEIEQQIKEFKDQLNNITKTSVDKYKDALDNLENPSQTKAKKAEDFKKTLEESNAGLLAKYQEALNKLQSTEQ